MTRALITLTVAFVLVGCGTSTDSTTVSAPESRPAENVPSVSRPLPPDPVPAVTSDFRSGVETGDSANPIGDGTDESEATSMPPLFAPTFDDDSITPDASTETPFRPVAHRDQTPADGSPARQAFDALLAAEVAGTPRAWNHAFSDALRLGEEMLPVVTEAFTKQDEVARRTAATLLPLLPFRSTEAVELRGLLASTDEQVRTAVAVWMLQDGRTSTSTPSEPVVQALARSVMFGSPSVREQAVVAACNLTPVPPTLVEALRAALPELDSDLAARVRRILR